MNALIGLFVLSKFAALTGMIYFLFQFDWNVGVAVSLYAYTQLKLDLSVVR